MEESQPEIVLDVVFRNDNTKFFEFIGYHGYLRKWGVWGKLIVTTVHREGVCEREA